MRNFQFRPGLSIATFIAFSLLLSLGVWQVKRLQWKLELIEKVENRTEEQPIDLDSVRALLAAGEELEYQPMRLMGRFEHQAEAHVFGTWEGAPGWYIMTPLRFTDTDGMARRLLVNRGFVPMALKERAQRPESLSAGEVTVTGLFRSSKAPRGISAMVLPSDLLEKEINEFFSRDIRAFEKHLDLALLPFILDSSGAEVQSEWPKGGTTRLSFNNRHLEYALTWFGLALTLLVIFGIFSRKPRQL